MATLNSQLANLKPFNGTNFSNWEFRLKIFLEQHNALNVLEQNAPTGEQQLQQFKKDDAKARNIMVQWLADDVLEMVKDKKTAKDMFETLKYTYTRRGLSMQVDLQRKLRNMKYKEGNLSDFFLEFDKIVSDLKASGGNLEEPEIICQLLAAMPENYQALTTSIDLMFSTNPKDVTVQFVKNKLLQEEIRQGNNGDQQKESVAFTSKYRGNGNRGNFQKRGNRQIRGQEKPKFNFKCYKCGKHGHKRNECRSSANVANGEDSRDEEISFIANKNDRTVTDETLMFIIDSGATNHLVNKQTKVYLSNIKPVSCQINVAKKGSVVNVTRSGNLHVTDKNGRNFNLKDVLQSDDLEYNLLSVKRIEKEGFKVIFEDGKVRICRKGNDTIVLEGNLKGNLYVVCFNPRFDCLNIAVDQDLLHRRMGHSSKYPPTSLCEVCLKAKQTRTHFKSMTDERKPKRVLEVISSDVCGPISPQTRDNMKYYDEGWKLNRTNYYQEGWLATGNVRGIVGVTFTTSHCKKNVDYPLRTNHNLRGHRSEVILVKWNEPYQKLASCDSSGIIFVWIKYEGRWSIELINDRNTPVTHFSWSHDGRMALICYQDGFVLVGSVAGQRYWSSMLNLEPTITCGIWTPDDQQVYFGTTSGQIIVMDVHGAMVSQVQLTNESGITSMAWSCEKFKMEEGDDNDPGVSNAGERKFVLAVCLQNGLVYLLKSFDDVSPLHIQTGLQGPLCMEWSNSRELLAIAGVESTSKGIGNQIEYSNVLKFYNERGILLYRTQIPFTQAAISSLTWGHNDKRLFIATGSQIHIAWVSRRIATLQLLCRLKIHDSIMHESQLPLLPLPARIRNLIGNLFAQTIRCCVPEPSSLREFVSRPPIGSVRLHCTMIRHGDDSTSSSGMYYTLYLEYLGGLVPLLKGKRTSKIRPEFVIFDPQVEISEHGPQWSSETKSSGSSSQSTSGGGMVTDSSESEKEEGCTSSPRMQRKRKKRNKSQGRTTQSERASNSNPLEGESEELCYIDTLPEYVPLVEVTSNIWGTKFKIHGLPTSTPANLGQVTYKTSLLHLQPRQMTLIITELTDDFPVGPDPTFNPNLFSEDEDEVVQTDEKSRLSRVPIEHCPPIAPILPRGNCVGKKPSTFNSSFLTPESQKKNGPVLAKQESYEDEAAYPDVPEVVSYCDIIRPQTSNSTNNNIYLNLRPSNAQSTSFVGQFNKNSSGNATNQRHAISPLYCEGYVPPLQSPKNAVAPSDIIFDRPPAQTLLSYSCDYSNTTNVQQIKSNMLNEVPRNGLSFQSATDHRMKITRNTDQTQVKPEKNVQPAKNDGRRARAVPNVHLKFIDEENPTEAIAGPSHARTPNLPLPEAMVRSCSMGYLDMVDVQLVPSEVALLMLRKDAPRRLILVNKKPKQKRQSRQTSRHFQESSKTISNKTPNLRNCGKSKSLDSSDIFLSEKANPIKSVQNQIEEVIPEVVNVKKTAECKSTSSSSTDNENNKKECSRLGFFGSRSPLMRRKKDKDGNKDDKKSRGKCKRGNSVIKEQNDVNSKQNLPLHTQALTNLEKLITRLREDDGRNSAPSSPRLPRSSPASPAPSKKGKRPQSASPIRKNLLSSPLLGRKNRKNKLQESSDDDVTASGDEIFNGTNYRDLETFQKAQLRQKLKRGKIEPNGSSFNNPPIPQRREFVMHNKAPMWNENSQVYQLDFGGRVTQESAKNFQIEFRGKQVMQFGRIDGNAYTLDFQYPFSALQAFSVALANVTQRLK